MGAAPGESHNVIAFSATTLLAKGCRLLLELGELITTRPSISLSPARWTAHYSERRKQDVVDNVHQFVERLSGHQVRFIERRSRRPQNRELRELP